jgi:hypothetical protein
MSECQGQGCTHPECAERERHDPVVKYDGTGSAVRASQLGGNRAMRRQAAREARRRGRRAR